MPAVRFSRDKRGYEYVYLVHTPVRRGKPGRTRVLYWYRTPPGVRIGRKPFDEEVQRKLEQQNPGVAFDWEAIIATPMPPPDMTEFWRERRRAEKAARQERRTMEAEDAAEQGQADTAERSEAASAGGEQPSETPAPAAAAEDGEVGASAAAIADAPVAEGQAPKKRRRRRGGRRRRVQGAEGDAQPGSDADAGPDGATTDEGQPDEGAAPSEADDPASEGE